MAKNTKYILWLILTFTLVTRLLFLSSPEQEYFDEVYHAFTAGQILNGEPKAWEWWSTPPEGFAYEWTHPPVAKLGMALGMFVFGENSFGWRAPGALLGVGTIYLVYLIAKKMFDEKVALLAAGIFALDGLGLVMSRIGMNDIYFLFFMLASFYFFLRDKNFLSALFLGLAAASKWTFVWFLPVLALAHLVYRKKINKSLVWFLVLPPLVYLASYTPMFLTGHNFDIFWGVQKQMWWYHTGLDATHPYQSIAISWPVMWRPVWLYVEGQAGVVANIYAMGNPIVFWFGLVAMIVALRQMVRRRNRGLVLVTFAYISFFIPWVASPRIMFLYHYLPSLPFLAIATGFALKKYPRIIAPVLVLSLTAFLYFYPHWVGIPIPTWLDKSYYWIPSWR